MTLPSEIDPFHYLFLSAIVFAVGIIGVMIRRNILVILMSIELMLNACSIGLVGASWQHREPVGFVMVLFVIVLAAIEAAVGLAIAVMLFRRNGIMDSGDLRALRG